MSGYPFLDCPKCGESIPEAADVELEYYCYDCSLAFEYAVCPHCEAIYGSHWGDEEICLGCGRYTGDDDKPQPKKPARTLSQELDQLRRWNEGLGLSGRESYWI